MKLIDKEKLLTYLKNKLIDGQYHEFKTEIDGIISVLINAVTVFPLVDANPVVHGYWLRDESDVCFFDECSVCHARNHICKSVDRMCVDGDKKYCPNCGARMDGNDDRKKILRY